MWMKNTHVTYEEKAVIHFFILNYKKKKENVKKNSYHIKPDKIIIITMMMFLIKRGYVSQMQWER